MESSVNAATEKYAMDKAFKYKSPKAGEDKAQRYREANDRGNVGVQSQLLRDFTKKHGLVYSRARTR